MTLNINYGDADFFVPQQLLENRQADSRIPPVTALSLPEPACEHRAAMVRYFLIWVDRPDFADAGFSG
jgi:hypothetical protein